MCLLIRLLQLQRIIQCAKSQGDLHKDHKGHTTLGRARRPIYSPARDANIAIKRKKGLQLSLVASEAVGYSWSSERMLPAANHCSILLQGQD